MAQATRSIPHLTLEAAQIASDAAVQKAKEINVPESIAILDMSLQLLHFQRMPGARYGSVDIAQRKAFTAASLEVPTAVLKDMIVPGAELYGINLTNDQKIVYIGGGLPIHIDGQLVGAIGASSGSAAEDIAVAQAGVDAVLKLAGK